MSWKRQEGLSPRGDTALRHCDFWLWLKMEAQAVPYPTTWAP